MDNNLIKISKFLSLILRHTPEKIGLTLDDQGWADVSELISKSYNNGRNIDLKILEEIVATNNKKRFSFSTDKTKIRANQGHSLNIDLKLKSVKPPKILYHGTATRFIKSIRSNGLIKGNRQHVHLSYDTQTAINVGKRHGKPIVLKINSIKMYDEGYKFYLSDNNVWLTDNVPRKFINFN